MPFLFFASGLAALLYQIAWAKRLGLVLGADAYGVCFVLVAFMVGLAWGGRLGGRWADRAASGTRHYGNLELGIALLGALSPFACDALQWIYPQLFRATESIEWLRFPLRAALALAALLPPTILMGATFPAMAKLLAARGAIGRAASHFYAWNTLGACAGALVAGFVALPAFGIPGTIWVAAGVNFAIGIAARAMPDCSRPEASAGNAGAAPVTATSPALLRAVFLSGFASLVFEVVLTRNLAINFGATSYAFAIVLFVFLLGIGIGALFFRTRWEGKEEAAVAFARFQVLAGGLGILGAFVLEFFMPNLFLARPSYFPEADSIALLWIWQFLASAVAFLPLGIALGVSFPAAIRAAASSREDLGASSGQLYWWNTWGAAAGAIAATLILVPWLGSRGAMALAAGACLLAAWQLRISIAGSILVAALIGVFLFVRGPRPGDALRAGTVLFLEGPAASVSVEDVKLPDGSDDRVFRINGRVEASTGFLDMRLQRLLGHLPVLLHPDPQRVLVVGLGAGITAGASASSERTQRVQVVELNPEVREAALLFGRVNRFPSLPAGKLSISFQDAGNYLLATQERFDVMTSDPIHPWTAGSGNLYTVEYFQRMRARLAEDGRGIAGQWVPLYQLSMRDIGSIFASFRAAFPYAEIWLTSVDLVLIGSERPISVSESEIDARMRQLVHGAERDFEEIGIRSAADLLALRCGGVELIDAIAAGAPLNRDLQPFLEYSAPFSVLVPYQVELYERLLVAYPKPVNPSQERIKKALESFLVPLRESPPRVNDAVSAVWEILQQE